MKLHKAAHRVYKTQYHIVWVTRYRRKILVRGTAESLRLKLQEVWKSNPDWFIDQIGIEADHLHLHMVIPPKDAVASAVRTLKSVTSAGLKENFPQFLRKVSWNGRGIWGRGFFVSTVGINEPMIRCYVRYQDEQQHRISAA